MTNVITAKIVYADCDNRIWREIQISENSFLCQLGYTVLATFDTMAYHLFYIEHDKMTYELPNEDEEIKPDECLFCVKISELNLKVGDKLEMVYDFGYDQVFDIEITDISPMAKGCGRAYPKVIAGEGAGIIDDMPAEELLEAIRDIDKNGDSSVYYEGKWYETPWDYRKYDIEIDNVLLKGEIEQIADAYSDFEEYLDY